MEPAVLPRPVGHSRPIRVLVVDDNAGFRESLLSLLEAGNLQVHLSASNGDVLHQLHTIGDSLRQDLVHRQYGEVAVVVSDTGRDGGGQRRERDGAPEAGKPGRALDEADATPDAAAFAFLQDRESRT